MSKGSGLIAFGVLITRLVRLSSPKEARAPSVGSGVGQDTTRQPVVSASIDAIHTPDWANCCPMRQRTLREGTTHQGAIFQTEPVLCG